MRQYLTLGSSLLLCSLHAQVVLGPADMPSAGDTLRYATTAANAIDLALTGADVLWDYSALTPTVLGADTAVAVTSTPFLYQFFFNNTILYPQWAANYGVKGQSFGFQGVSLEDVYDYFKKDNSGFRNVGFGANVNGLPASVRRIPVDWVHRFPLEFGDQDTSFSAFNVSIPTLGYFGQTQTRINTVDGWGTLVLPGGTYEVLRVRSVLQRRDTLFVEQFGFGFGFNEPQTVEYKWLAPGMGAPVLLVTTIAGVPTTARFHHAPGITTTADVLQADEVPQLFPNPTNEAAFLRLPAGWDGIVRVCDALGREVIDPLVVRGGSVQRVALDGLPEGPYLLRFSGAGEWHTRIVVQR